MEIILKDPWWSLKKIHVDFINDLRVSFIAGRPLNACYYCQTFALSKTFEIYAYTPTRLHYVVLEEYLNSNGQYAVK